MLIADPVFLTEEAVLEIHAAQLAEFGGAQGVLNPGLLSSAVAQPAATFLGVFLNRGLHAMAAAYLYHLAKNHPFVEGNKRTAVAAALTFLELNGVNVEHDAPALEELAVAAVEGHVSKGEITKKLRELFPIS